MVKQPQRPQTTVFTEPNPAPRKPSWRKAIEPKRECNFAQRCESMRTISNQRLLTVQHLLQPNFHGPRKAKSPTRLKCTSREAGHADITPAHSQRAGNYRRGELTILGAGRDAETQPGMLRGIPEFAGADLGISPNAVTLRARRPRFRRREFRCRKRNGF